MWSYPDIDPIAISLGPISIHWYAISYLVGIGIAWRVGLWRVQQDKRFNWNGDQISDLIFYAVLGVIVGGRLGYMLFYNFDVVLASPLTLFKIWQGGMSFHGGMLGVFAGMYIYSRWHHRTFFSVTDFIAPMVPLALGSGRLGNFANTELPGRVTDVPWAVIFPGELVARHPSSLYQFFLEGPVLFAVLWIFSRKKRPEMAVSGLFLIGYGLLRVVSEFFREPDAHINFVAFGWLTMGQILSVPMVVIGVVFMAYAYARRA